MKSKWKIYAGGCNWCTKLGWKKLRHVRGQGQKPGGPHAQRAATKRRCPTSEVRGSSRECQAATVQERLRGQGRRPRGATPRPRSGEATSSSRRRAAAGRSSPRSGGCTGIGGPRGAIPCWRSGKAAVRSYPSSKVRSSGCALLKQLWRDTPRPR